MTFSPTNKRVTYTYTRPSYETFYHFSASNGYAGIIYALLNEEGSLPYRAFELRIILRVQHFPRREPGKLKIIQSLELGPGHERESTNSYV